MFNKCAACRKRGAGRSSWEERLASLGEGGTRLFATRMEYPMYTIRLSDLLALERLQPHQELLLEEELVRIDEFTKNPVIFVSHEWLGWSHPDPKNVQLQYLKSLISDLQSGRIPKIESHPIQKHSKFGHKVVMASEWKSTLPSTFVWWDYLSVPQPGAVSKSSLCSDHRLDSSLLAADLARAVESLPAYVEHSTFLFVVAPPVMHHDSYNVCNYRSWRSRGWCRLEALSAILSSNNILLMVCNGQQDPFFLLATDHLLNLRAGAGQFTCCAKGHVFDGREIACDRKKVAQVLSSLISLKQAQLKHNKKMLEFRHLAVTSQWQMAGLGTECTVGKLQQDVDADTLRDELCWSVKGYGGDEKEGWTLLHWAAIANCATAAHQLLERGALPNAGLTRDISELLIMQSFTPLHCAMVYAEEITVAVLLDGRANPFVKTTGLHFGMDPFILSALAGRAANIQFWLRRFPDWNVQMKRGLQGINALIINCLFHPHVSVARALFTHRADVNGAADVGHTPLTGTAMADDCNTAMIITLLDARADVNGRFRPQTLKWRSFFGMSCGLYGRVSANNLFKIYQLLPECTALHCAGASGHADAFDLLIQHGADTNLRNRLGWTPSDGILEFSRGEPPQVLVDAMDGHLYHTSI